MSTDKKLRGELDRYYLSAFVRTLSVFSSEKEYDIKKYVARSMYIDISTLNKFLAGRSQTLSFEAWPQFPANGFKQKSEEMYEGKGARDFIQSFNLTTEKRWIVFPITCVTDGNSEVPGFFRDLVSWSIETIGEVWDKANEVLDVKYWAKVIELFPWRLLIDSEYFVSLFLAEDVIEQRIHELEEQTTAIKNIPYEMLGEFAKLKKFIEKHGKKRSSPKGTSWDLIQKLKKQGTSIMRLKRFAECSPIFSRFSIRTIDIYLYSLIYCLPADKQAEEKQMIVALSQDESKHRTHQI